MCIHIDQLNIKKGGNKMKNNITLILQNSIKILYNNNTKLQYTLLWDYSLDNIFRLFNPIP